MAHETAHPQAGQTIKVATGKFAGAEYRVEDWWDRIAGKSWMDCDGNPACLTYVIRSADEDLPMDDEVVYGKIGFLGHIIHVSQLAA